MYAQEVEITNHNFEGFHDFPTAIYFAEDAAGDIWVLQNGGFDGNIISKYSGGVWESVAFEDCDFCVYNMKADNEGTIYVSSGMGFYARESGAWVRKSEDITAREDFTFDVDNRLWFEIDGTPKKLGILDENGNPEEVVGIEGQITFLTTGTDGLIWFKNNNEIVSTDGTTTVRHGQNGAHMEAGANSKTYFTGFSGEIGFIENETVFEDQYPNAGSSLLFTSMAVDAKENFMWLGIQGFDAGIELLNLETGESKFLNADDLYIEDVVGLTDRMYVTSDGTLWAAGHFHGQVVEINPDYISSTKTFSQDLSIFPNPTSNNLIVSLDQTLDKDQMISVYDQLGKKVLNVALKAYDKNASLDLSDLRAGVYFLQLGKDSGLKKIIKE